MERFEVIQMLRLYRDSEGDIRTLKKLHIQEEQREQEIALIQKFQNEISVAIKGLDYVQKDAILSHYVRGQKWAIVRRRHCYSEKQIRNISNNGLLALGKQLDNCETACYLLRRASDGYTT